MLITAEHRREQCKFQRQLVLDSLRKFLSNIQSRLRYTQILVNLVILQTSLVR